MLDAICETIVTLALLMAVLAEIPYTEYNDPLGPSRLVTDASSTGFRLFIIAALLIHTVIFIGLWLRVAGVV